MDTVELCYTPAVELARHYRAGELSPVEVTMAVLERIDHLNPRLNAYCTPTPALALEAARGAEAAIMRGETDAPLLGVPISVKDLILTAGVRTTRGSLLYADYVPDEDAPVVERVKRAGAVILGKTNTPELGWRGTTDNRVFGPSRNPWDTSLTPGGSSGGAAAQVAAGLGPLALGTDGGGSVRIPASYCGIFGLKPHAGRVPVWPASATGDLSHVGPMTRTVADAALLLGVLAGPDERDRLSLPEGRDDYLAACAQGARDGLRGVRVAWSPTLGYASVDPEVRAIAARAAARFAELSAEVEETDPAFPSPYDTFNVYFYGGITAGLATILPDKKSLLDHGLRAVVEAGGRMTGQEWGRAAQGRMALWERVRTFFGHYDLLLTPTMPQKPFPVGTDGPRGAGDDERNLDWTPFTYPFNLTGQPVASVPCGWTSDGLPVGLQIVGRRFAEATVLRAAAAFEALQPWADRQPPLD